MLLLKTDKQLIYIIERQTPNINKFSEFSNSNQMNHNAWKFSKYKVIKTCDIH